MPWKESVLSVHGPTRRASALLNVLYRPLYAHTVQGEPLIALLKFSAILALYCHRRTRPVGCMQHLSQANVVMETTASWISSVRRTWWNKMLVYVHTYD